MELSGRRVAVDDDRIEVKAVREPANDGESDTCPALDRRRLRVYPAWCSRWCGAPCPRHRDRGRQDRAPSAQAPMLALLVPAECSCRACRRVGRWLRHRRGSRPDEPIVGGCANVKRSRTSRFTDLASFAGNSVCAAAGVASATDSAAAATNVLNAIAHFGALLQADLVFTSTETGSRAFLVVTLTLSGFSLPIVSCAR